MNISRRLSLALAASLLCHALLFATGRGTAMGTRPGAPQLLATLLASGNTAPLQPASPAQRAAPESPNTEMRAADAATRYAPGLPLSEALATREPPASMTLAAQGRIVYSVLQDQKIVGRTVQQWQHDGSTYMLIERHEAPGEATQTRSSRGLVSAYGLVPVDYHGDTQTLSFDWQALRLHSDRGDGAETELRLRGGTQDSLSLPYHLGQALLHGRSLQLAQATAQDIVAQDFVALGEETVHVAGRDRRLLHLKSTGRADTTFEMWISLDPQHLPLRLRQRDELGQESELLAESIETR